MGSQLTINVLEQAGDKSNAVLMLKGSLDASTYTQLEEKADGVLADGVAGIVLDLHGVDYMGSAGLRAFQIINNKLKEKSEGKLRLLNCSEPVSRVLKTLGFDSFFDIYTDLDAALSGS